MNWWASLSRRSRCWRVASHCVDPPSPFSPSVSPASPEPSAGLSASSWWSSGHFGSTRPVPEEKMDTGFRREFCTDLSEDQADLSSTSPSTCHCPDARAAGRPRPSLWTLECTGPCSCPSASGRPADWSTQKRAGSATDNLFLRRQARRPKSADTQMIQADVRDGTSNHTALLLLD